MDMDDQPKLLKRKCHANDIWTSWTRNQMQTVDMERRIQPPVVSDAMLRDIQAHYNDSQAVFEDVAYLRSQLNCELYEDDDQGDDQDDDFCFDADQDELYEDDDQDDEQDDEQGDGHPR